MTKVKAILWAMVSHPALGFSSNVNLLEIFDCGRKERNRNKKNLQSHGIKALVLDQPTSKYSSQRAWLPAVLPRPTPIFVPAVPGLSFQAALLSLLSLTGGLTLHP